jgi:hypothetical protein
MGSPEPAKSLCPDCGRDDQVRKIATVLDTGSTASAGVAQTTGVGVGLDGNVGLGLGSTSINISSRTGLVARFSPPARPGPLVGRLVCLSIAVWIATDIIVAVILPHSFGSFILAFFLASLGATFATRWAARSMKGRRIPREQAWELALVGLRKGFYCYRDDVAFAPGGYDANAPQDFSQACFADFRASLSPSSTANSIR